MTLERRRGTHRAAPARVVPAGRHHRGQLPRHHHRPAAAHRCGTDLDGPGTGPAGPRRLLLSTSDTGLHFALVTTGTGGSPEVARAEPAAWAAATFTSRTERNFRNIARGPRHDPSTRRYDLVGGNLTP
ncbi:hypothetical protein [Saccharothrix yanglingensis]|uniref:hypothetical protein n=1 Tax=Saccharothrix yanglingensis TaxID=659496 RepID=UPI0027D25C46|nr:hypothetical protein [Saccharothrix yanglingensis]